MLATLGIKTDDWLTAVKHFRRQYGSFAGTTEHLRDLHINMVKSGVSTQVDELKRKRT